MSSSSDSGAERSVVESRGWGFEEFQLASSAMPSSSRGVGKEGWVSAEWKAEMGGEVAEGRLELNWAVKV